jgi:hypothetical protein
MLREHHRNRPSYHKEVTEVYSSSQAIEEMQHCDADVTLSFRRVIQP